MTNSGTNNQQLTKIPPRKNRAVDIRRWVIRLTWALIIITPLVFFLAAVGSKLGLWDWKFGLGVLTSKVGPKLLMVTAGLGVLTFLSAFIIKPRQGMKSGLIALVVGVGGLAYAGSIKSKAGSLPLIHDISTDTQNPPVFTDAIVTKRAQTPNVNTLEYTGKVDLRDKKLVSVLQVEAYPDLRTLVLSDNPSDIFDKAMLRVGEMGWDVVTSDRDAGVIEATDTTFWYGFKDDVVIRIQPSEGGGTVLDVRSVSRVGASDIGANANRIRRFLKDFSED